MFHWLELRAFCHATEDEDRVLAAMRTVVPDAEVATKKVQGHHGNPILALTARVTDAAAIEGTWRRLLAAIGKDEVLRNLDDRLDDDAVYHLRLEKQDAHEGRVVAATTDDVIVFRAKVAAYPKKREVAERTLLAYLDGL